VDVAAASTLRDAATADSKVSRGCCEGLKDAGDVGGGAELEDVRWMKARA